MRLDSRATEVGRRHEPLPHLYDRELARFAPSPGERRVVGVLMRLLRLPGAMRLIRAWHSWHARAR